MFVSNFKQTAVVIVDTRNIFEINFFITIQFNVRIIIIIMYLFSPADFGDVKVLRKTVQMSVKFFYALLMCH